jgi:hypothetical protein
MRLTLHEALVPNCLQILRPGERRYMPAVAWA